MPIHLLFYSYFHDCVSLIVRLHIQTHVQNIHMVRKTEADKMIVLVDTKCKSYQIFLDQYKLHSVQKETQTFKQILFRVKVIDFQNDSISVAWSFNKELYNSVSSKTGPRVLFWE